MNESEIVVEILFDVWSDKLQESIVLFFGWQGFELNSSSSRKGTTILCFENMSSTECDKVKELT